VKEAKKALRRAVRAVAPAESGRAAGDALCAGAGAGAGADAGTAERIEALPEFAATRTVALYCSLPGEAPTGGMLRRWFGMKRLALPVIGADPAPTGSPPAEGWRPEADGVVPRNAGMTFREYTGEDSLTIGAFGIREPAPVSSREAPPTPSSRARHEVPTRDLIPPSEIDLMIVPGVAFDSAGRRLGRGKGFYDRYLSQPAAAHIYKVGLCAPHALVPEIPAEAHDIEMDEIILVC
jgi:5-formyltetrahydrofolate cyclo-ligase